MAAAISSALPRFGAVSPRSIGMLALAAALMTAGLITYGSWVRVSGSGLGCPDWPLCQGGVTPGDTAAAIEFGHRVYAGLTMLAVFAAAALAFPRRAEISARRPSSSCRRRL